MRNPNCKDCGLWKTAGRNICVPGDGPSNASILIIGEAPGEEEARTGKPFVGRSGKLLRAEVEKAGLKSVRYTNIVRCRPPQNRKPTNDEIKACRKYLDVELKTVKPDYVVAAGGTASSKVLKDAKITTVHGKLIEEIRGMPFGVKGYPIFHPAYVLRDPGHMNAFRTDLQRLSRIIDGSMSGIDVKVEIVDADNVERFIQEFTDAPVFAFDKETPGLFPYNFEAGGIRCLAIGLPGNKAWVIRGDMPDSPFAGKPEAFTRLVKILVWISKQLGKWAAGQNAKFDNNWLWVRSKLRFFLDFDTMIAHHTLDENSPHDLEVMARMELDVEEYDIPLARKNGSEAWKFFNTGNIEAAYKSCTEVYEYAGRDAVYTLLLAERFNARFKKDRSLRNLFYKLIMPANRALCEIESVGLTIDMDKRAEVKKEVTAARDELMKYLMSVAPIKWSSPAQVCKVLYEQLGLECTVLTDGGKPSSSEAALVDLAGSHPVVDKLIEYRKFEKFLNTYIDGWDEWMHNGRLYVSYKQHGTVTGRYSSRLHSIPRDGTIRNLGTAPDGWYFFQADVSQAELRIVAEMSGDPEMRRCFTVGPDIHWRTVLHVIGTGGIGDYVEHVMQTARKLNPKWRRMDLSAALQLMLEAGHEKCIAIWSGWKEARKKGKAINFGFVFGMYENKFIETTKLDYGFEPTWDEAHLFRTSFFQLYQLERWHNSQKAIARIEGQVRNLAGRVRRLPSINSSDREARGEAERQAVNAPVQGFIGDWKAAAMVEIHTTLPKDRLKLVGEHHDALLGIVRKDSLHLLGNVRKIMKNPRILADLGVKLSIPMESEIEVGNWGAGRKWEDDLK